MKEYLSGYTLFNTITMYIKESSTLLLVVEGDNDRQALKDHCSPDLHVMVGVGGRPNLLKAAELVQRRNVKGVRFLVDRDFDNLLEAEAVKMDLVWASTQHDLFMDFQAGDPALLPRVIDVQTASARRQPDRTASSMPAPGDIAVRALELATKLAAIRLVNARRDLGLDFKRLSFFQLTAAQFDIDTMSQLLVARAEPCEYTASEIIAEALAAHAEIAAQTYPPVGDHDLFAATARILKLFGVSISDRTLQASFIVAITCSHLVATDWYEHVRAWCAANELTGFRCDTHDCVTRWNHRGRAIA